MRSLLLTVLVCLPWLAAASTRREEGLPDLPGAGAVAALAGEGVPAGILRFAVVDADGTPLPARLTFVREGGDPLGAELFPVVDAAPRELAVRRNVVYSLSGTGAVTVPVGRYDVYASRGLEWSLARRSFAFAEGEVHAWRAELARELDTRGFVGADFHLHTLTHSGHGDANLEERIISLAGEGVELAVATDHNHNTDYRPPVDALGAGERLATVTGNEVSTPIGHFNAFPLDPERPVPDAGATDANALFRALRAEPNRHGVTPVVQLNHPRWRSIDYFGLAGLDPVTGTSADPAFSPDFDTVEVFNENVGWGYRDADVADVPVGSSVHSVLRDWFTLLNRGRRVFAVGNSDSHTVHAAFAGYPRNFVASSTDRPAEVSVGELVRAVRAGRLFTTIGPFVDLSVHGARSGSLVAAQGGRVEVALRVQAASWIDCDRVKLVVNGDVVRVLDVPATREPVRLDARVELEPGRDAWLCVLVEGDDSLAPIVVSPDRPVLPLAVTNPIWIDADADGEWRSPWERALAAARASDSSAEFVALAEHGPSEHALGILAAAELEPAWVRAPILGGLADRERLVRLAAARAAERRGDPTLVDALDRALAADDVDPYLHVALLRAWEACGGDVGARVLALVERAGSERLARYGRELAGLLPGRFVDRWQVAGYFDNPEPRAILDAAHGPEARGALDAAFTGGGGRTVRWRELASDERGFLDLRALDPSAESSEQAIAYAQAWLHAPRAGAYAYALGTDDGCRAWLGSEVVFEDASRHGADPLQTLGRLELEAGWNRLVLAVENGGGAFGLYFRVLDEEVTSSTVPR